MPTTMSNCEPIFASPAFVDLSVLPVPQHIELQLHCSPCGICNRNPHAEITANVLTMADGHLHLRQNVPVSFCAVHQVTLREKLEHRRPCTTESVIGHNGLPDGGIEEDRLRRDAGMPRQIGAELGLDRSIVE